LRRRPAFARAAPYLEPERAMSTVAAICIVAFLVVMGILNKVEFGHFD
jgi:hypothetical protein